MNITKLYICVLDSFWNLLDIEMRWQILGSLTKRQSHETGLGNDDLLVIVVLCFGELTRNTKPGKVNKMTFQFDSLIPKSVYLTQSI